MIRRFAIVLLTGISSLLFATPAQAAPIEEIHGTITFINHLQPCPQLGDGTVTLTRGPAFSYHEEVCSSFDGVLFHFTGDFTMARPGATLTGTLTTQCSPLQCLAGSPPLTLDLVVTGGSHRYRHASGALVAVVEATQTGGALQQFAGTIDGTIVRR